MCSRMRSRTRARGWRHRQQKGEGRGGGEGEMGDGRKREKGNTETRTGREKLVNNYYIWHQTLAPQRANTERQLNSRRPTLALLIIVSLITGQRTENRTHESSAVPQKQKLTRSKTDCLPVLCTPQHMCVCDACERACFVCHMQAAAREKRESHIIKGNET